MTVPQAVKRLRRKLGHSGRALSQEKLGRAIGVSAHTVASWEQGLYEPEAMNFVKLARLCAGDLAEFFARRAYADEEEIRYDRRARERGQRRAGIRDRAPQSPSLRSLEKRIRRLEILLAEIKAGLGRVEERLGIAAVQPQRVKIREAIRIASGSDPSQKRA